jgi:hypothetical protein
MILAYLLAVLLTTSAAPAKISTLSFARYVELIDGYGTKAPSRKAVIQLRTHKLDHIRSNIAEHYPSGQVSNFGVGIQNVNAYVLSFKGPACFNCWTNCLSMRTTGIW